jgi:hypothetical protein|tara:strand:- start:331 stop:609 length:279 start_codon:yes stop_codon:yes gene_type:complete
MNDENIDPENLSEFNFPESILSQIFEFTGSTGGDSGFILTHVNQMGTPSIITKASSPIVEMGLRKALEQYLEQVATQDLHLDSTDLGDEESS